MKYAAGKWIAALSFILLATKISFSQQILFRNYTVAEGLCANTVWAISQDNEGYMWFGTKDGLSRFDGYQFKSFRFDKNTPASIGNNWIRSIFNYNADSCWIGTERGIYILDLTRNIFHFFKKLGDRPVFDIARDDSGHIWISTGGGVFRYDPSNGHLKQFIHQPDNPNSLSINFVRQLLVDNSGKIWMGTSWEGIDVYDPQTKTFSHFKASNNPDSLSSNFITKLYKDKDGNIWVGTEKGGLDFWNQKTKKFTKYQHNNRNSVSDNIIHDIYESGDNKLYIGTEKGLDVLNLNTGKFSNYAHRPNDAYSLSDNAVYAIYQDQSGGIWVGTYFGGVNYFHPDHTNFELYYPTGDKNSISGKAVSAMLQQDSTHIWVGTEDGGLNYFNTKTRTFNHYPFKPGQENLSYHNIHTLAKDRKGNIWIGTFTGGINILDPETGKVTVHKFGTNSQASTYSNMIYDIYEDQEGKIWIGTVGGLFRYNPVTREYTRVTNMNLNQSWVYDIDEDDFGTLWLGTYNHGLYKKDKNTGKWSNYIITSDSASDNSEKIIALKGAEKNNLWLGTDGGGLYLFNTQTGKSLSYKNKYGLNADIVYGILKDNKQHLWLSTNNGLYDFDPVHKTSRHYSQWDHLQGRQFNYKSYLRASDGKFYFGGVKGLNAFYPDGIHNFKTSPHIIFTNFQLFNRDVTLNAKRSPLQKTITYTKNLILSHEQSMFSIEYAALNYIAPQKTGYAYKMEGYDQNWNYVEGQRKATYTNLPAGNYIFKVKATDYNGNWNKDPVSMDITIRPPFYDTTLAYIIYVLLVLGIFWFFRKTEIKRMRKKNQMRLEREQNHKEHEFYKQKIDFFTSMAHEIRTPLSLIIAPLEKLLNSNKWEPALHKQLTVMEENSNRLLSLTNQLLDFRKMEADLYEIHPEKTELVSFVQSLFSRFSSISYQKGIKFSISTQIPRLEVQADTEALTKILSNLLFNAFKFTRTKVELNINEPVDAPDGSTCFSISVEDDGIGIPKDEINHIFEKFYQVSAGNHHYSNLGGNGIGLSLAKALTEKHHGELKVESNEGVKTIFTVRIPFNNGKTENGPQKEIPQNGIDRKPDKKQPTILVVEDDPALVDFIYGSLVDDGYNSRKAREGTEALKVLQQYNIDLIISDVMMPEMDGMEFCKKVKGDATFSHIPFILLTAKANPETEIEGIEEGADAYITKPFQWKHLSAVIRNLLESRQKLKLKFSQQPFADAATLTTNTGDQKFIKKITDIIEKRLDDQQLSVEELSSQMSMSRSSLHKKLKAISGHAPNEFIRIIRLKQAARLILQNEHSIAEIGYMTGFNSPSYFSKCFYQQFNVSPREFLEKQAVEGKRSLS